APRATPSSPTDPSRAAPAPPRRKPSRRARWPRPRHRGGAAPSPCGIPLVSPSPWPCCPPSAANLTRRACYSSDHILSEFSARAVTVQVLEPLERRRPELVGHDDRVREEIKGALAPVRRSYAETELPGGYIDALERELAATVPARWRAVAEPFTRLEQAGFRLWRGGDPIARLSYVLVGLVVGGL